MNVFCTECHEEKDENEFYKRFIKNDKLDVKHQGKVLGTVSTNKYGICKDCLAKEVINNFKLNKGDYYKTLKEICEKYNLPFIENIIWKFHGNESENNIKKMFSNYIEDIIYLENIDEEKSDIDFINDDIKQLKKNIEKAIQKEDFNAHNKWMNCLRDAIELRETLKGVSKYTINLGTINVNSNSAEDLINELTQIAKKQVNCR